MPEKKRFLKSVMVNFISLVDRAANRKTIIFKSKDSSKNTYNKTVNIAKLDDEQRIVYGIVYAPDQPDSDGDYTTAKVIKQMAYDFMQAGNTGNVDNQHDNQPDEGFIAESWILERNDPRFPDEAEGSWAVGIKVTNNDTWSKVKSGEITGLSMGGVALVDEPEYDEEKTILEKVIKAVKESFNRMLSEGEFNHNRYGDEVKHLVWAFADRVALTMNDTEAAGKKAAILEYTEEFKKAIENFDFDKILVSKTNNPEGLEMNEKEINALVEQLTESAVEKAVKPLKDSVAKLQKEFEEKVKAVEERLTALEEATPGSKQEEVSAEVEKQMKSENIFF